MKQKNEKLKVLFVSSEVDPFVKTGGLADVAGSLPQAIKSEGHDIRVVLPEYKQIANDYLNDMTLKTDFRVDVAWRNEYVGVNYLEQNDVSTYFIDNKSYFYRDSLYDNEDKDLQFAFFCRAVLEMLPKIDFQPDIIHCNDWQTGPLSIMLKEDYQDDPFYNDIKTIYTIHNLRYQGVFDAGILADVLALDEKYFDNGSIEHDGLVNYMKMGLNFSDYITTVSKTYAEEIKTPEFGEGLDYVLRNNSENLFGIINGIDYDVYNPATDNRIYSNFSTNNLSGKWENKKELQKEMGLPQRNDIPLIGLISRLVDQKGLDLIAEVMDNLLEEKVQFLLLGTGQKEYEEFFAELARAYPNNISANIKYDANLAQKIYAGSDMFLMPSKYEPCGLGQLFSLRYGTIPIVRKTGGLADTIKDYDKTSEKGNGFVFSKYDAGEMLDTIRRALSVYNNQRKWEKIVKNALKIDYSWNNSAQEYISLYQEIAE